MNLLYVLSKIVPAKYFLDGSFGKQAGLKHLMKCLKWLDDTTENEILHPQKNSVSACVIFFLSSSNKVSTKDFKFDFFCFEDDVLTNEEVEIDEVEGVLIEVKVGVEDLVEIFAEDEKR